MEQSKNLKMLDTVSLATYEPNRNDIYRALGVSDPDKVREQNWANLGSKVTYG